MSQILNAILANDYASAINIITDKDFNPNEVSEFWGTPIITGLVIALSLTENDLIAVKEILTGIIANKNFNPNIMDSEGETVLMHIAKHKKFNWLVPVIFNTGKVDLSIKNFMHHDLFHIAKTHNNNEMLEIISSIKNEHHKGLPVKRVGIKSKHVKSHNL